MPKTHQQILATEPKTAYSYPTLKEERESQNRDCTGLYEFPEELPGWQLFYTDEPGAQVTAKLYLDAKAKPTFYYSFRSVERFQEWASGQYASAIATRDIKRQRAEQTRLARSIGHGLEVGDLLVGCWGYEQTNYELYRVTKVSGAFISIQRAVTEDRDAAYMQTEHRPDPKATFGPVLRRRPTITSYGVSVRLHDCCSLHKANETSGRTYTSTHYA